MNTILCLTRMFVAGMHRNTFNELLPLLTVTLVSALKLNIQVLERWRGLGGNVRLSRLLMTSCLVSHGQ